MSRRFDDLPAAEFAFPGPLRDQLVAAILAGAKTATSALAVDFERAGESLPLVGEVSAVVDSDGRRVAAIEMTEVRVVRLADIDLRHAVDEGEGDRTVAEWRAGHERFWHGPEVRAELGAGFTVDDDTLVVAQRFRLVHPLPMSLRPLTEADLDDVHEWAARPEASRYQSWGPNTPAQSRAFVESAAAAWRSGSRAWFPYAVEHDSRVVGAAELTVHGGSTGEIGFTIHPDLWGRGLATGAARRLLDIGFGDIGLHRIQATCDPRNAASGGVLRNAGLTYEGRMREALLIRDGWRDSDLYAILTHEHRRPA